MTIKQGFYDKMTPTEQMLYDAHSLLWRIDESFILISKYLYLDRNRSEAIEVENQIKEFLKRPLYEPSGSADGVQS